MEWVSEEQILVPLVAEVTAGGPFHLRENETLELFDITHLPGINKQTAMNCYGLRVRGDFMIPFHKDGDILIVDRDSQGNLRHGDIVVCHKEEGCYLRSLDMADKVPKLRPLDLDHYTEPEQVASSARMDKILFIISS